MAISCKWLNVDANTAFAASLAIPLHNALVIDSLGIIDKNQPLQSILYKLQNIVIVGIPNVF